MTDLILFPNSFFEKKKPDEDFQNEYNSVLSSGLFKIMLFDYYEWFNNNTLKIINPTSEKHKAVYRGWMMQPEKYSDFYNALSDSGIKLITNPEQYSLLHIFPNSYNAIKDDTAKAEFYPLHEKLDVERLKKRFGKFMVKDYVKSVKGTEFPAFFDENINQSEFDSQMEIFYKYRGNLLTGGLCIKEYLNLKRYNGHTNEYRVFYINNRAATVSRNSGQGNYSPEPPKELLEKYSCLKSPYYTVDYAEIDDGSWKIIEVGDGGVSGLSDNQDYDIYFRTLYNFLNI